MKELVEKLKTIAKQPAALDNDDFTAYDYSGGNYDDAFYLGVAQGEVSLARELLETFFEGK